MSFILHAYAQTKDLWSQLNHFTVLIFSWTSRFERPDFPLLLSGAKLLPGAYVIPNPKSDFRFNLLKIRSFLNIGIVLCLQNALCTVLWRTPVWHVGWATR